MKKLARVLLLFCIAFFITTLFRIKTEAAADPSKVIINELMPNPVGSDTFFEWLELYNNTPDAIDLTDWSIDGAALSAATIPANGFLIIARNLDQLKTIYPNISNGVTLSISLNNTTDTVVLKDQNANVIDTVSYAQTSEGKSLERKGPIDSVTCNALSQNTTADSIEAENSSLDSNCWPVNNIDYPEINLSEFAPVTSDNNDWIEIFNPNEADVDLSNYFIQINSDQKIPVKDILIANENCINNKIKALNYCLVQKQSFLPDIGTNTITLYANDTAIESVEYEDPAINSSFSLFRGEWVDYLKPSPNNQNKSLKTIQISEVYPSPETGESEWIEVYNSGDAPIDLDKWFIQDKSNNKNITFPKGLIYPKDYLVVDAKSLNNSDEEISLFDYENELIDKVNYEIVTNSDSVGRDISSGILIPEFAGDIAMKLSQTLLPTPGEENQFSNGTSTTEIKFIGVKEAKTFPNGTLVYVQAVASVEKDLLGKSIFYIQDSSSGIKIDLADNLNTSFTKGQIVRVKGVLSESTSERKVNVSEVWTKDADNLSLGKASVNSLTLTSLSSLEKYEGRLIHLKGVIANNYSTSFDIQINDKLIRVTVLSSTGIKIPTKSKGDTVEVSGILSQYNNLYRILPRYSSDLEIVPKPSIVKASTKKTSKTKKSLGSVAKNAIAPKVLASETSNLPFYPISNTSTDVVQGVKKDNNYLWVFIAALGIVAAIYFCWVNKERIRSYLEKGEEKVKEVYFKKLEHTP